ncbi:hypothetical protein [Sphingobium sp. YR768]|uniref:hypothetical protein n=1 Tax=Sphingobium sp. YR768 TaxID=1884365 RepID=UPI0015A53671|nr:hypothetical protein [Sphingobium sp. YR768]
MGEAPLRQMVRTCDGVNPYRGPSTRDIIAVRLKMDAECQVARFADQIGAAFPKGKAVFDQMIGDRFASGKNDLFGFFRAAICCVPSLGGVDFLPGGPHQQFGKGQCFGHFRSCMIDGIYHYSALPIC